MQMQTQITQTSYKTAEREMGGTERGVRFAAHPLGSCSADQIISSQGEGAASRLSPFLVSDSATPWTVAHQAPLSMGVSRQGCWSGLPSPPPGDLPNPGIEPTSLGSPALMGGYFTSSATWGAQGEGVCIL